jgi:signal transduction histidine kinase
LTSCEQALPVIKGDYERLLRVFSNLVSNAVKFSLPGSTVWVSVVRDSQGVRFTVSDNGPGIAESDLPFIFDRYWQVKKREHQGVGLGLAIVKTIIEAHGGTIRVSSTLGEGSDFCFHLPLA